MSGSAATGLERDRVVGTAEGNVHEGDTVLLQAGDLVPADLELLEARGLEVDEWELTGEIPPVEKRADEGVAYLYRGSRITRGSGKGVVIATGEDTEYGKILKQPWEHAKRTLPPLIRIRRSLLPCVGTTTMHGSACCAWQR
jgi:magnesium-transporting ATPase (P-type)